MGAVPVQGAMWAFVGEARDVADFDQQPAPPEGPIPRRLVKVVPDAASSWLSSLFAAFLRRWIRSRSLTSSATTRAPKPSLARHLRRRGVAVRGEDRPTHHHCTARSLPPGHLAATPGLS